MTNLDKSAKRIGRNITNLLIENEKSQQELADAIGVSKSTVSTWTNGKRIPRNTSAITSEKTIGHSLPVHSLRHTYTSLMAEAGVPIETISRQLGHADSKVTRDIYMHVTDKIRKADNSRLDAVKIL